METTNIYHHGIKGQKWGIRRFQNLDRTWTEEGKRRYGKRTVFVSGSSKTQDPESPYSRTLPDPIRAELDSYIRSGTRVIVGDAPGIDRQVQDYLRDMRYSNVEIYGPGTKVRYTADERWKTNPVDAPEYEIMSSEWLAKKDIAMEKAADFGLAVVLDEGAKATRKNVERLIANHKDVKVYELSKLGKEYDRWL